MLPPLGALIVGPCPNCNEMVVVFCGRALPLDKEVMLNGSDVEKHEHLRGVLIDFLESRIATVVEQFSPDAADSLRDYSPEALSQNEELDPVREPQVEPRPRQISDTEFEEFVQYDLPLLDNGDYFKTFFE